MRELDAALENALKTHSKEAISKTTFKNILSFITRQFDNLQEALHYMSNNYFLAQTYLEVKNLARTQMIIRPFHSAIFSTEVLLKVAAVSWLSTPNSTKMFHCFIPYWNPNISNLFPGVKHCLYSLSSISKKIEE